LIIGETVGERVRKLIIVQSPTPSSVLVMPGAPQRHRLKGK
jgi:hypothetical protein